MKQAPTRFGKADLFLFGLLIFLCLPGLIADIWKEFLCAVRYGEHKYIREVWKNIYHGDNPAPYEECERCGKTRYVAD
jgi:hypothetical protein